MAKVREGQTVLHCDYSEIDCPASITHGAADRYVAKLCRRSTETRPAGYIESAGSVVPLDIKCLEILGAGRAAEARLVQAKLDDGSTIECVEKVFAPGRLTRLIYRICFQAPFAYQVNRNAIQAAFYRRRVAWALCKAFVPQANVARPLYVRWDHQTRAFVLASELVRGRGIMPQPADDRIIRRALGKWMVRGEPEASLPEEMQELLAVMHCLERLFLESGLVGTGWQVCRRAIVSTANLLRTPSGYVSIDLESGIPAMLVSTYVVEGLRLGSLPLFDDLDPDKLDGWLKQNRGHLAQHLSSKQFDQLNQDARHLIDHTEAWKESEPAIFRRPSRLFNSRFRTLYRNRVTDQWSLQRIWDETFERNFRGSNRSLCTSLMFWLGCIPGFLGRFLQAFWSNHRTRAVTKRLIAEPNFRGRFWRTHTGHHMRKWQASGRLPLEGPRFGGISPFRFFLHRVLAATIPANLHRLLTDALFRKNWLIRIGLLCVSPRFQSDYGRLLIGKRIQAWQKEQRMPEEEKRVLLNQLEHPAIEEYLRGFGIHVGLKLLLPLVLSLKALGAAVSLASGNPIYFLIVLMTLPLLRTVVTLWRMAATGRPLSDFREALIVGALPSVGSLAFPVQMYATCGQLSTFLLRDFAARAGRWLPIYGGKDSRTELACIKFTNVLVELMEVWLAILGRNRRSSTTAQQVSKETKLKVRESRDSRWDRLAEAQLEMARAENNALGDGQALLPHGDSSFSPGGPSIRVPGRQAA